MGIFVPSGLAGLGFGVDWLSGLGSWSLGLCCISHIVLSLSLSLSLSLALSLFLSLSIYIYILKHVTKIASTYYSNKKALSREMTSKCSVQVLFGNFPYYI